MFQTTSQIKCTSIGDGSFLDLIYHLLKMWFLPMSCIVYMSQSFWPLATTLHLQPLQIEIWP